ncbi:oligosaccharide flippase family protein [Mucilaginibacter sp. RS28]|uniref:Oligosaccharide flippase family protein n=2 Tax=Mucilaginibacter straminoryzae TaxID=2932774 RepID=A0A9X2BBK6_9SPHI|nr:oligosaccharide flippase family protein [Mucilaginibacter straminoryzae]
MTILGMVTTAVIYRQLPMAEAGQWIFFQSTFLLIDTFRSGFLTTAFIKFYAGAVPERKAEVAGSTWFIGMAITGILIACNVPALLFTASFNHTGILLFLKWFGVAYLVTLPMFVATCIQQGEQRFDRLLYIRLMNKGSFIIFIIVAIALRRLNLDDVLYSFLASNLLTSAYAMLMQWSGIRNFGKRSKNGIRELFNFGKYSVGTTLSANMFGTSDTYIIMAMLGPAALAVYNLGRSLMQVIEIPLVSFAATGMPLLSAAYNQNKRDEVIATMKRYTGLLTLGLIPIVLVAIFVADFAISLIGGGKYVHTEAANVFRLFMTFGLLYPADRFFALTLDVIHRPQVNFYKVLVMLAANIIFDFVGIAIFGNVYGVAITTVIPTLIAVAIGYRELNKYRSYSFFSVYATGFAEARSLIRDRRLLR